MILYLDSADATSWYTPPGCAPVRGITTNPSLVHAAALPVSLETYRRLIQGVQQRGLAELMLQLPSPDVHEALRWSSILKAAALDAGIELTIKLPCHPDWAATVAAVQKLGLPVLLTGVSNSMQLLWAQAQGARYVAPYIGRLQADGRDVWPFLEACVAVQRQGGPRLLAASIKSGDVLSRLLAMGAYAVTVRPEFAASLVTDPLTDTALRQFEADIQASLAS